MFPFCNFKNYVAIKMSDKSEFFKLAKREFIKLFPRLPNLLSIESNLNSFNFLT